MEMYLRNTETGLLPLYDSDDFEKRKLKIGQDYKVEIKKARNFQFHKKYFALIRLAYLNMPEQFDSQYPHPENLRKALQIEAGYFETSYTLDGMQLIESKSIAFDKLDEDGFQEVYNKVLDVILKWILPNNTSEEIEKELINFL